VADRFGGIRALYVFYSAAPMSAAPATL